MKIYKVEINERHGYNTYSDELDECVLNAYYFSTEEKAKEFLSNNDFIFSPTVILCGDKIIRVCKSKEEANDLIKASKTISPAIWDLFFIDSVEYEYKWVWPNSLLNKKLDDCTTGRYATIDEITVM